MGLAAGLQRSGIVVALERHERVRGDLELRGQHNYMSLWLTYDYTKSYLQISQSYCIKKALKMFGRVTLMLLLQCLRGI